MVKDAAKHLFAYVFIIIMPKIITINKIIKAEVNLCHAKNVGYQTPQRMINDTNKTFAFNFHGLPALLNLLTYNDTDKEHSTHSKNTMIKKHPLAGANNGRRRQLYRYDLPPII